MFQEIKLDLHNNEVVPAVLENNMIRAMQGFLRYREAILGTESLELDNTDY